MSKEKRSFFERLTGTVKIEKDESPAVRPKEKEDTELASWIEQETDQEGELTVDVYQNGNMIVVKSMVAGVRPEDLDITITRDMVTIRGKREEERIAREEDYLVRELYWGSFSRMIALPEEIDVDSSEAVTKHGLLILKLPKFNKKRSAKVRVKMV